MAIKLSKMQAQAIISKLGREVNNLRDKLIEDEKRNYTPSSDYTKFAELLEKRDKFKALSELLAVDIRLRRKVAVALVDVDDAPVRSRLFRGHAHNAVAALKCGRLPAKWFTDVHSHSFLFMARIVFVKIRLTLENPPIVAPSLQHSDFSRGVWFIINSHVWIEAQISQRIYPHQILFH